MSGKDHWRQLRDLFDAVCDLPPDAWRAELERLTRDPQLLGETLELLQAQTRTLERARAPVDGLLASMSEPELRPGDTLGPWRLVERLASGGMGVVFAAERADELYTQKVAVKLLRGLPDPRTAERLAEERRILASLQHPNIARLYDGGTTAAGMPYLVMEFVEGQALDAYCRTRAPDLRQRLVLFVGICRAVQAAHARLVVHCDLKPGNILVRADGEPVLLDFGIARLLDAGDDGPRTGFCTPAYAAPETLAAQPAGVASDVFSLGVILLEMLTGRRSERGAGDSAVQVPAPSAWAPADCAWRARLRGDPDAIVARACALQPEARYASVEALANDVQRYLDHRAVAARRGSRLYRSGRALRRHWRGACVAVLVLALCAGFVWRLDRERDQARHEALVASQVGDFLVTAFEDADPDKRGTAATEATAREVLDAGAARIDTGLADSPAVRARLMAVIGQAYKNIGQTAKAEDMLRKASDALLAPGVEQPAKAAGTLGELAVVLANDRRAGEAEAVARRALALADAHGDAAAQAHAWNSLGLALKEAQDFDGAQAAFERALALFASPPAQPRGTVTVRHNLGLLHRERGDYAASERELRDVLALREELDGAESADAWSTRQTLAGTLLEGGHPEDAEALYRQNLALAVRLFGEKSAKTGVVFNQLANVNQDLGHYAEAADDYRQALRISAMVAGEDSTDYMVTLNNLATLEESRGNAAEAEALYRRSLEFRRRELGAESPGTLRAEANLGRLLMRMGRMDEAGPLLSGSFRTWSARLEPTAPDMLFSRLGWAEWQLRTGRHGEARATLEALLPDLQGKSPQLLFRHRTLEADLALREGDPATAALAWTQALAMAEELFGADTIATARWRVPMAEALLAAGDLAAARDAYRRASPVLRAQMLPGSDLLQRLDRLQEALHAS